jgi:hypothetical protein
MTKEINACSIIQYLISEKMRDLAELFEQYICRQSATMHTQQLYIIPLDYKKKSVDSFVKIASLVVLNHLKQDKSTPYILESRRTLKELPTEGVEMIRLVPHIKNSNYDEYPKFTDVILLSDSSKFYETIEKTNQMSDDEFFKIIHGRRDEMKELKRKRTVDSPADKPKKKKLTPDDVTGGSGGNSSDLVAKDFNYAQFLTDMLSHLPSNPDASKRNENWKKLIKLAYPAWFSLVGFVCSEAGGKHSYEEIIPTVVHMDPVLSIFMLCRRFTSIRTGDKLNHQVPSDDSIKTISIHIDDALKAMTSSVSGGNGNSIKHSVWNETDGVNYASFQEGFDAISTSITMVRDSSKFNFVVDSKRGIRDIYTDSYVVDACKSAYSNCAGSSKKSLLGYSDEHTVGSTIGTAKSLYRIAVMINSYIVDNQNVDVSILAVSICSYSDGENIESKKAQSQDPYVLIGCFSNFLGGMYTSAYTVKTGGEAFDGPLNVNTLVAPVLHYSGGAFNSSATATLF